MSQKSDVWIIAKESRKNFGENMQTEGVEILKAATLLDYVIYITSSETKCVKGRKPKIKGKSALMIFDRRPEYRERNNRYF